MISIRHSLIFLIVLFPLTAFAQPDTNSTRLSYSQWTIDFGIQNNFTLGSYLGSALSVSHFTAQDSKWQFGIAIGLEPEKRDESLASFHDNQHASQYNKTSDNGEYSLSLTAQRVHYSEANHNVRFYAGWGPIISGLLVSSQSEGKDQAPVGRFTNTIVVDNQARSYSGGLSLLAGVEWNFSRNMSLHAHYSTNLLYFYIWTKERTAIDYLSSTDITSERIISSSGFRIESVPILFGISIAI